jgi:hypothetical protein
VLGPCDLSGGHGLCVSAPHAVHSVDGESGETGDGDPEIEAEEVSEGRWKGRREGRVPVSDVSNGESCCCHG